MEQTILQNSQALLATVLSFGGAYGTYAVKKIFDYFMTKTTVIKDTEARDVANNALSTLDTLLETNITYAENVLKQPIVQSIKDGKVTKDELKSLANIVKTNVTSQLTDSSKTALSQIAVNVEDFIDKRLEKVLGDLKVSDASSVKATEIKMPTQQELDTVSLQTQLNQAQADKNTISQQLQQLQNDKSTVDQANAQLSNQVTSLTSQNTQLNQTITDLQAKLSQVQNVLGQINSASTVSSDTSSQVVDNASVTSVTDATTKVQA
jgi:chromosome segregation ATPase